LTETNRKDRGGQRNRKGFQKREKVGGSKKKRKKRLVGPYEGGGKSKITGRKGTQPSMRQKGGRGGNRTGKKDNAYRGRFRSQQHRGGKQSHPTGGRDIMSIKGLTASKREKGREPGRRRRGHENSLWSCNWGKDGWEKKRNPEREIEDGKGQKKQAPIRV